MDASFDLLDDNRLGQLCGANCARDLETARAAIKTACTFPQDVMVSSGSNAYPGMWRCVNSAHVRNIDGLNSVVLTIGVLTLYMCVES
jgi:hypothetical protein